ncbi:MAG: hypothetical protein EWV45_01020 [Microcystis flos-aquae Mf_QC_C_20070823_S10D]|uniref:Uncharacterized protein n=1 Tax=Microcystis flos-aquae Mf_QC_C_20070823_S10D TaxID=2486236 RepID=A0A552L801_9CHRO|nr:MAG: hypothetical protein EWV65_21540 [Microcystis flos-aquae Ma_QC_C_20070823_S18D]TRV16269.1 MAG: hypothetical protein EWV45_01020 [Microcystis flos-aquae Mf_QC_C_20070823_S10D]TRV26669.1 MAG: hypothetical protein EWV72_06750 [Microcystis flos-aquae Mf_QC_C_20070823_S10]TRV35951.1 MAG: hypothetical protein EWV71_12110 [Microcystis flos-aquae Mf_QC_C_20070823_S20D]TRV37666.1 MAG: hypothetical protein EWV44_09960 [Microcystis flos-aquae Mf_QC_C_20070823_S20T]TRV39054.1 MAG: hypothetical pro
MIRHPLIKGGLRGGSAPPLSRVDPPAYRHPPYQGGQGGSNLKSIFNLIITSYLTFKKAEFNLVEKNRNNLSIY